MTDLIQTDEKYMRAALSLAQKAYDAGDTPVGAVIVYHDEIIGAGYNSRNAMHHPLRHAEIDAIDEAAARIGDWRLEETTLYVTLEPCPMCAGAIVQARIPRVVIGAMNPKAGCAGSVVNLLREPRLNHQADVTFGICESESRELLQKFFADLRQAQKEKSHE